MIRVEQSAYGNRWRGASPGAKALFAACGMAAAFLAATPGAACAVAFAMAVVACLGAGIPAGRYLRVAAPPLLFLVAAGGPLAVSLAGKAGFPWLALSSTRAQQFQAAQVSARSLACLASLLFLALTTPMTDLIGLLRRLGCPAILLDLMSLCYRTLFVFSDAVRETATAQEARLGYADPKLALRSTGGLVANLTAQVLHRSRALHLAALARNQEGPFLFLPREFPGRARHLLAALLGGGALVALVLLP